MHTSWVHTKTTFFFLTQTQSRMQKCDSSALPLLPVGDERPLLCTCATEIDKQAVPAVYPEGVSVVQYVLSRSSKLFFSPSPTSSSSYSSSSCLCRRSEREQWVKWYVDSQSLSCQGTAYGPKHCQQVWTYTFHLWYKSFVRCPSVFFVF